jgi:hypothetical protein
MIPTLVGKYILLLAMMTAVAWLLVAQFGAPREVLASVPAVFFIVLALDVWRRRWAKRRATKPEEI